MKESSRTLAKRRDESGTRVVRRLPVQASPYCTCTGHTFGAKIKRAGPILIYKPVSHAALLYLRRIHGEALVAFLSGLPCRAGGGSGIVDRELWRRQQASGAAGA